MTAAGLIPDDEGERPSPVAWRVGRGMHAEPLTALFEVGASNRRIGGMISPAYAAEVVAARNDLRELREHDYEGAYQVASGSAETLRCAIRAALGIADTAVIGDSELIARLGARFGGP